MTSAQRFSATKYWKVTVKTESGQRVYWARDFFQADDRFRFRVVDREGVRTNRIVFGFGDDLVRLQNARLNLFFGQLQVCCQIVDDERDDRAKQQSQEIGYTCETCGADCDEPSVICDGCSEGNE